MATKTCSKCTKEKSVDEFAHQRTKCKRCTYDLDRERVNNNQDTYFKMLLKSAMGSSRERAKQNRIDAGICTLILDDIKDLYTTQKGLCYYSNIPLCLRTYSDWQCSLERLDPSKGYILGNVCLIAAEFQGSSQWSPAKIKAFHDLYTAQHDQQRINWSPSTRIRKTPKKVTLMTLNGVETYNCNKCHARKPVDQFQSAVNKGCKECQAEKSKQRLATPLARMSFILHHMKVNSKMRKSSPPDISVDDLIDIFDNQGGLCAYTGIPMTFGSYLDKWWTASPERKDIKKGYSKDNICFVCFEFNTADRSARCVDPDKITGNSAWSRKKVQILRDHFVNSKLLGDFRNIKIE